MQLTDQVHLRVLQITPEPALERNKQRNNLKKNLTKYSSDVFNSQKK